MQAPRGKPAGPVSEPALERRHMLLSGWGGTPRSAADVLRPHDLPGLDTTLRISAARPVLARGLGRSYGDAALNAGGTIIDMTGIEDVRNLDLQSATITAGAGLSIDTLLDVLLPLGYFLPVTPGTRHVTLGGALAADIHGKNHHADGSIQDHVVSFALLKANGETVKVCRESNPRAFAATLGGLGLTGIITEATFHLLPVESAYMRVDRERAPNIEAAMERLSESEGDYHYSVAWVDCLARGSSLGRSVLMLGNHAARDELPTAQQHHPLVAKKGLRAAWPSLSPGGLLRKSTLSAFNELYYRKPSSNRKGAIESFYPYFYPLDGVANWNRAYGPRGFVQYQVLIPFGHESTMVRMVETLANRGCPSFLAVLKRMRAGHGLLSFPAAGWTLALDIPAGVDELAELLDELDDMVVAAGGRVYLAKDARVDPAKLRDMYPDLETWREIRRELDPDGRIASDLGRRLNLL
jgi:decaprenylphospho-beta-D-ribofuranose 2-oxidase